MNNVRLYEWHYDYRIINDSQIEFIRKDGSKYTSSIGHVYGYAYAINTELIRKDISGELKEFWSEAISFYQKIISDYESSRGRHFSYLDFL